MIADMQQSIATLMVTIAELVQRVNRWPQVQAMKSTKSIVNCPKPWDGKGDSAAACHFLATYVN
jgi:hypothetical protein